MMNKLLSLAILLLCALTIGLSSCKEEKKTNDIITKLQPKKKPSTRVQVIDNGNTPVYTKQLSWLGGSYTLTIHRYTDRSLPLAMDEDSTKYYDNKVDVKITRHDGSVFFSRTFQKSDFSKFINNQWGRRGAFLGLMFDRAEGNDLLFGASVGSPDKSSDEFIPIDVIINNMGEVRMKSSQSIEDVTDDSQPRDEADMAEEEGM